MGVGVIEKNKLVVLVENNLDLARLSVLAQSLEIGLCMDVEQALDAQFFLTYRDGSLCLLDRGLLKKGGLMVLVEPRYGEQRSWPAPKEGALAQAIGRKTRTVVDATTGWAQDSLHIFRMGYRLFCIERSPVMGALLSDGFERLMQQDWVQRLALPPPMLFLGDAIQLLTALPESIDCIYLDPMFPPKRKKSALAKKSMTLLRELLGDDLDREQLFAVAMQQTGKRVVVKSPDHAEPLGGKPDQSFHSKLLRYDVYLKK